MSSLDYPSLIYINLLTPIPSHIYRRGINLFLSRALAVSLGSVVTADDDEVLSPVVELAGEVGLEDGLGAVGVTLLGVQGGAGHVGDHGVAAAEGVLGVAEDVVLGGGLGVPDVTTVSTEVAGGEGVGDILLDDDGTTGGVDEPRACRGKSVSIV